MGCGAPGNRDSGRTTTGTAAFFRLGNLVWTPKSTGEFCSTRAWSESSSWGLLFSLALFSLALLLPTTGCGCASHEPPVPSHPSRRRMRSWPGFPLLWCSLSAAPSFKSSGCTFAPPSLHSFATCRGLALPQDMCLQAHCLELRLCLRLTLYIYPPNQSTLNQPRLHCRTERRRTLILLCGSCYGQNAQGNGYRTAYESSCGAVNYRVSTACMMAAKKQWHHSVTGPLLGPPTIHNLTPLSLPNTSMTTQTLITIAGETDLRTTRTLTRAPPSGPRLLLLPPSKETREMHGWLDSQSPLGLSFCLSVHA